MSGRSGFAARPAGADAWVRADGPAPAASKADVFTARLTVDVTPELRGRIKVAAFRQGVTVAEMLRALLDERFPPEAAP
jgi:hypothetical protein